MPHENYLQLILREFERLKMLADKAISQVADDQFFTQIEEEDNNIAIIIKHMAGNMRSRWRDFLTTDGEKPDRNRDGEFVLSEQDTRQSLSERWEAGWDLLFGAIQSLDDDDLDRTVTIRDEEMTVLQATGRQLSHYAYHVGQIVFLARHFTGKKWETLSVPKGGSTEFNTKPSPYLESKDA